MDPTSQPQFVGVRDLKVTRWHNPTPNLQRVIIDDGNGQKFLFSVPPGETKELDSRYDRAIHIVDCGKDECHKKGWFCHSGHDGLVVGGGAPLLKRVGKEDGLDPSLDPGATARKAAEKRIAEEVERQRVMSEAYERQQAERASLPAVEKPQQHQQQKK